MVGWTDLEGSRPYVGAVLLGYYDDNGRLIYAGRSGTGISDAQLKRLWQRLQPLAADKMPLERAPPRSSRFGSPLELSPALVVEVAFLAWTEEGLLRQVTYQGLREDKPAKEVRQPRIRVFCAEGNRRGKTPSGQPARKSQKRTFSGF